MENREIQRVWEELGRAWGQRRTLDAARLEHEYATLQLEREQRLSSPEARAAAAIWYASQGIPVFPCRVGEKRPATRHGVNDATTDIEQVSAWWTANPHMNIGVACGVRFDVVDVDGEDGMAQFTYDTAEALGVLGWAQTPRGSHFYLPVTGSGNSVRKLPGLDFRGQGGYVIAPPSQLSNGATYRWVEGRELSL